MDIWEEEYERKAIKMRDAEDVVNGRHLRTPICAGVLFIILAIFTLPSMALIFAAGYLVLGIAVLRKARGGIKAGAILCILGTLASLYLTAAISTSQLDLSLVISTILNLLIYAIVFHLAGKGFASGKKGGPWLAPFILSIISTMANIINAPTGAVSFVRSASMQSVLEQSNYSEASVGLGIIFFLVVGYVLVGTLEAIALYQACHWAVEPHE